MGKIARSQEVEMLHTMIKKWDIIIPELTGKEKRKAYVYLPNSYFKEPGRRYPVLYMFDGHNLFSDKEATYGKSWGLKDYLDFNDVDLIIAAVECNHSPDGGRLSEYSPYDFSDHTFGTIKGQGKTTMDWMVRRFKPLIDRRYRTIPNREHTFIAGSSMGGLMSLYALIRYNRTFSRAAALSPSLWVNPDKLEDLIRRSRLDVDTVLYMDYGQKEMESHLNMNQYFRRVTAQLQRRNVLLTTRIIPGGTHSEASWERQLPFVINTLLYEAEESQ